MDGIISAPICLAGFFLLPDLPENTRAFYLTEDVSPKVCLSGRELIIIQDRALAKERMASVGRAPRKKLTLATFRKIFSKCSNLSPLTRLTEVGRWHVYLLTILYVVFINIGPSGSVNPFSLWLKSKGLSVSKIVSKTLSRVVVC